MITSISIENVKGYGSPAKEYSLMLSPDRVNLLIAPNGYGKSSLAAAFGSLREEGLILNDDDKPIPNAGTPKLSVTMDGVEYAATDTENAISPVLSCKVIKNRLDVHAKANSFERHHKVFKYLKIETITICKQEKSASFLSFNKEDRAVFGSKTRLLSGSRDVLSNNSFASMLKGMRHGLDVFSEQVGRKNIVNEILEYIRSQNGSADEVARNYDKHVFDAIESDEYYQSFSNLIDQHFGGYDALKKFIVFYQLVVIYQKDHKKFREACDYAGYCSIKEQFNQSIQMLDTTARGVQAREINGELKVEFPKAKTISNGQRDVLTFIIDLLCFKSSIEVEKPNLLIIDEIFDYLDDANTLAAQYFLTEILKEHKGNIYLVLLTHLSPENFRSYVFNKLNVQYLKQNHITIQDSMKKFIAFRQQMKVGNDSQKLLYENISHHLLHFAPGDIDIVDDLKINAIDGLKTTWGKKDVFQAYLIEELNKYVQDKDYDPYAVAVALRLRTEAKIYRMLPTADIKDKFVDIKETKKKLEFAEQQCGITVASPLYAVSAIHNEADHIRMDSSGNITDTPMVYKLEHVVIKKIIQDLFDYKEGEAIGVDSLRE